MTYTRPTRYDYNGLDHLSRVANWILGDRTGRTITQRTQDGFLEMTDRRWNASGFEVHLLMGLGIGLSTSKNKVVHYMGIGLLLLIGLAWLLGTAFRN